jgi:hypothetical protein
MPVKRKLWSAAALGYVVTETGQNILVGLEDLEGRDNLCKSNALVGLPVLVVLRAVDVDEEIVSVALVVDDRLLNTAASHVVLVVDV